MSWSVPAQEHKIFERNPLVAVVVELRFHPILQVPNRIADFQDRIRGTFPGYQDVTRQLVSMGPLAPVELRQEKLFNFTKVDEATTLSLTTTALTVECRKHEQRETFIGDVKVGIDALSATYGAVAPVRLGLRYVDVIDKQRIEADLARASSWGAIVTERFLRVPTDLADLEGTVFACEVSSPMAGGGAMTVRHGLVQDADGKTRFRLDVDRYVEGLIETAQVVERLGAFADDTFAVFVQCMGADLKAWMPERRSP